MLRAVRDSPFGVLAAPGSVDGLVNLVGSNWKLPGLSAGLSVRFNHVGDSGGGGAPDQTTTPDPETGHLIRMLRDSSRPPGDRHRAIRLLGCSGELGAVAALSELAVNRYEAWGLRRGAVTALGNLSAPEGIPALIAAAREANHALSEAAFAALSRMNASDVLSVLKVLIKDRQALTRLGAARTVAQITATEALPLLVEVVKDRYACVRSVAEEALTQRRDRATVSMLIEIVRDRGAALGSRCAACRILGALGDPAALPALEALATDGRKSPAGRIAAAEGIGGIGGPTAVEVLSRLLLDADGDVRVVAGSALVKIGSPDAHHVVMDAARRGRAPIRPLVQLIGEIKDPARLPLLIELLEDGSAKVRGAAAEALGRLKDPAALSPLNKALHYPEPYASHDGMLARVAVVSALGSIGHTAAMPMLINALECADHRVRVAAFHELVRFDEPLVLPYLREARGRESDAETRQTLARIIRRFEDRHPSWGQALLKRGSTIWSDSMARLRTILGNILSG